MTIYEEGIKLIEKSLATAETILYPPLQGAGADGKPRPVVRDVDAYYEDGVFYITTHVNSNKIQQIEQNPEVSIAVCSEWFTANGIGENLGWVLDPKNAELRTKLRTVFAEWYDIANNEKDEGCCILAIRLTRGTLNINHWEKLPHLDFVNKTHMENGASFNRESIS